MKTFVVVVLFLSCFSSLSLFFFFLQLWVRQENPGWKWCVRATADSEPFPANGAVSEVVEYSGGKRDHAIMPQLLSLSLYQSHTLGRGLAAGTLHDRTSCSQIQYRTEGWMNGWKDGWMDWMVK